MKSNIIIIALAGLSIAACTTPDGTDPTDVRNYNPDDFPLSNTPIRDENGDIMWDAIRCQREITGSRLPGRRICMSERQWAQVQDAGQRTLDEMQRSPQQNPF